MTSMNPRNHPRGFSRRALLKMAGLVSGGLFLAACDVALDPPDEPAPIDEVETPVPADDPEPEPVAPDGPRHGGRLRWGTELSPDGFLDPALGAGLPLTFANWIYEPLVNINEEFSELVPRLAVSWHPEDEGRTWVFDLRQGVRFHHEREFVADDVVHTFERILDPDFGSPGRPVFSNVTGVEAVDEHTVRFSLATASADFATSLTGFQAKIVPYDLTDDEVNNQPRGTGPFRIENYANADRITFQRNDEYWDEERPYLDEVEMISIPEATTLVNTLQAGDLDAIRLLPIPLLPIAEADPSLQLSFGPAIYKDYMFMRLDVEPFNDDRVRRAFKLIADREAMTEVVWGEAIPARPDDDNPVIPTSPVHADTNIWQQDLEEARRLLEEAGYGDGLEVDLWTMNDKYGVIEFCLAFADWAEQAGVTVNVQGMPSDRYYAEMWLEASLGTVGWSPRTTVDEQLRIAYSSEAAWNETRYESEEFDAMLDEALAETDESRRAELYGEIQRKLITEGGQLIHCHYPYVAAMRDNVHGYKLHPMDDLDPRPVWLS